MSKYGNRKTEVDGILFDSAAEAQRYQELNLLEAAGEITELTLQPRFELLPAFRDAQGKKHRRLEYVGDFMYVECETNYIIVEDVKGMATREFRIKEKLFRHRYNNVYELRVIK